MAAAAAAAAAASPKVFPLFGPKGGDAAHQSADAMRVGGIWAGGYFHPGCCCVEHDPEQLWAKRSAELTELRRKAARSVAGKKKTK